MTGFALSFYAASMVLWLGFAVIWNQDSWVNVAVKIVSFLMAAGAFFLLFNAVQAFTGPYTT